jgi:tetratricopeptide (TPR) repeat protein
VAVHPSDAAALNLLGVMYETLEKFKHALESYQSALFALQDNEVEHLSMVKQNIARCMCSHNHFEGSLEIFEELKSVSIWSTVVHGLAFLFTENLQNAFKCFEDALSTSLDSEDITLQNDICYVLSQELYALGHDEHIELAKQQLLST